MSPTPTRTDFLPRFNHHGTVTCTICGKEITEREDMVAEEIHLGWYDPAGWTERWGKPAQNCFCHGCYDAYTERWTKTIIKLRRKRGESE